MIQSSYSMIADKTIRNFIKAVVLIDDHWAEAQNAPVFEDVDPAQLNLDSQSIPPQDDVDSVITPGDEENSTVSMSSADPTYLREIGKEITKQGFLFTGLAYTDALKEIAIKLASKSDILILDWLLGTESPEPALELLTKLKDSGSPRFVFILTDQTELDRVRAQISERLCEEAEGAALVFSCGPFSFSLKNKPQAGGSNTVQAEAILEEAIFGIRARFGGLLQLAALELLGQYRDCLHEVLDHFHADMDFPFILEWLEKESPIRDSHSFNALAIDEWTARVTRRFPASVAQTIKDETVSALLIEWNETMTCPENLEEKMKELFAVKGKAFPSDEQKVTELMESLGEWLALSNSCWPGNLEGSSNSTPWGKYAIRLLAMNYLSIRKGVSSPIGTLTVLDALFQCHANLPSKLQQGTVLMTPDGNYLICITPACDCSRPARIRYCYVFLESKKIDISTLKDHLEGAVVAIRTKEEDSILLAVTPKPTFTYKIANPSLESDLQVSVTYGSEDTFVIKPIAQLRPARVQSLISLAAGKAIEVGLDRSELLRQLCKPN
ncbi:MAG: hypothetical protein HOI47_28060 [Candidatus Scalindua sp.]|jgi:hypothetical protein|nr:hypothetical protein [Candidatus Scalindua sp.]MBT6230512.1 hypothetical protein [Candidatus Scalindua sp.]